jgi:hypothetical protein
MIPSLHSGLRPQRRTPGTTTADPCPPVLARLRRAPWAVLITLLLLTASAAAASAGVVVTPWGPPVTEEFPPDDPPTDPPLPPGADADATPWVSVAGGAFTGTWNAADSSYTVGAVGDITVSGHTLIRVPSDADSALRAHESGHDSLNHYEYDQNAKRKVEDAMRGFSGMKFKGEGATNADRAADALAKAQAERDRRLEAARKAIADQMNVINSAYDRYTDNGQSPTVNTIQGISQAIAKHYVAPPAGLVPRVPDTSKSFGSAYGGSQALYDPLSSYLLLAGAGLINEARDPMDPIMGRGMIHIDPLVVIGAQENGTVHLADTYLRIVDLATGDSLMNGYLAEVAYMPSNAPGYLGMIQAYLEIPPTWAHGIENTIGSPFLAGMEVAAAAGEMTTAWLYSTAPMFDPLGNCLMPPGGVPLAMTLGIAVGQPSAVGDSPGLERRGLTVYPQPGRGTVRFAWKPTTGPLDLEIFDASGARRWATRLDGTRGEWHWQGRDAGGQTLRAGVYFARLHGGGLDLRARVVLVR